MFVNREQRLRRSYVLYDKNCSGKITKEEMVETLSDLGKIKTIFDEKGKLKIPNDVENLFR
jgi:Ca2+-binding EF-hand superfamily protein